MNPVLAITNSSIRVLIVDDERANREVLGILLAQEGFMLLTAASGEEALALVAQQPPDLILLDIMMPDMDGYQVARHIKSNPDTKRIPIIMVTALDDRNAKMLGLKAGAEDFLTKPVDRVELSLRVRNLLRLKVYGDYFDRYSQVLEGEVLSQKADIVAGERLYRTTFDEAPVGIVHVGLDGQWLRVNRRICDLLGYSLEELQSPAVHKYIHSEEPEYAESFRTLATGTLERQVFDERRYRRGDGRVVWARVNISVLRDSSGLVRHFILVIEDITERRTLDAQIRQSNKMDSIGRLAAGVAHDFNNLLTIILGFAEILTDDPSLHENQTRDLGEITKAARSAAVLTKQLLAFSRQQVLRAESLDVNDLIKEMIAMLDRLIGAQSEISLALAPNLSRVLVDRGQLEQVVMNLVVNALDAMPTGGIITIETQDVELENSPFHHETVMDGPFVMLAISDTGCGMSREVQRHIFEPFFTTKEVSKGTGLGLSTTYGIVKQSKGYIWVYSEVGHGTTFKVYLPRTDCAVPLEAIDPIANPVATKASGTVLLVDDEAGLRDLAQRILEHAGYLVVSASNADDAEKLYALHSDSIDLVVTDVIMKGCNGPSLLSRLRAHNPTLKVLYISGYTEQVLAHFVGIHDVPFVQKPFTAAQLSQGVREALDY